MRYVIAESPDAGERNRHFNSLVSPRCGKRVSVAGRPYEALDIELCPTAASDDGPEVMASARRIG